MVKFCRVFFRGFVECSTFSTRFFHMDRLTNVNGVNLVRTCKMGHFTCISTLNDKTSIQYSPQRPHVGEQFGSNDLKHPKTERPKSAKP